MKDQQEINQKQRSSRAANGNKYTKKYEKTRKGFLMRTYRNMLSRTRGLVKPHMYKGLPILDKEDFYEWAINCREFDILFNAWEASGYNRKYSPSIDRIDTGSGYTVSNMRWLTHSANSYLGSRG